MRVPVEQREALIRRVMADVLRSELKGLRPPTADELRKAADIATSIVDYDYEEPSDPRDGVSFI